MRPAGIGTSQNMTAVGRPRNAAPIENRKMAEVMKARAVNWRTVVAGSGSRSRRRTAYSQVSLRAMLLTVILAA
jgi:hypothetical protein